MGVTTAIATYLIIWWVVLFAILPLGTISHAEAGIDLGNGGDPGAPVDPKLKKKFLTTTWVSAIIFVIVFAVIQLGIIPMPSGPANF